MWKSVLSPQHEGGVSHSPRARFRRLSVCLMSHGNCRNTENRGHLAGAALGGPHGEKISENTSE